MGEGMVAQLLTQATLHRLTRRLLRRPRYGWSAASRWPQYYLARLLSPEALPTIVTAAIHSASVYSQSPPRHVTRSRCHQQLQDPKRPPC